MNDEDLVRLRPVGERDLEALERVDTDPALSKPFEWTGFQDPRARRRRWEQDGYLGGDYSLLIVALPDGTFVGFVCWWPVRTGGPREACLEIGILLFPDHRGKGLGSAAQRLLADYLFSTTLTNRLQALTDVDNIAEQRALRRAGFSSEGVMRGAAFVGGRWRDAALHARLREDPSPPAERGMTIAGAAAGHGADRAQHCTYGDSPRAACR